MLQHRRDIATTHYTQDAAAGGRAPVAREDPRTPRNNEQVDPPPQDDKAAQLAQLRELKAKLDEDRECLVQLERALEQDRLYPHGGGARGRAREVYRQIAETRSQSRSLKQTLKQAQPSMAKRLKVGAASKESGSSKPRPPTSTENTPPRPLVGESAPSSPKRAERRKEEREREQKMRHQPQEEKQLLPTGGEVGQPSVGPQLEELLEQDRRQGPQEPQGQRQETGQQSEELLEPPPHSPPQPGSKMSCWPPKSRPVPSRLNSRGRSP
ncbi:protein enabled homolog [Sorghum bicolor]|uniref:protein enabled homolog n=1 Tax=Sorghum bicolor TaxID=4558 RepID=UPI000B426B71|nr:protein enabled homolog [Sorghum bicolor]|eukprot:XP_021315167.1 protein enabled homolog [Sorghum bicolor]